MVTPAIRTLRVSLNEAPLEAFARMRGEPLPFLLGGTDPQATTVMGSRPFAGCERNLHKAPLLLGQSAIEAENLGRSLHRFEDIGDVIPELELAFKASATEFGGSGLDLLSFHA